jgi:hypothetical protein
MYAGGDPQDVESLVQKEIVRRSELPALWALHVFEWLYLAAMACTWAVVSLNTTFTFTNLPSSAVPGYSHPTQTSRYGLYWWGIYATDPIVCVITIGLGFTFVYAARKRQSAGFIHAAKWVYRLSAAVEGVKLVLLAVMWAFCKSVDFCRGYDDPTHPNPIFMSQLIIQTGRFVILIAASIAASIAATQFAQWLAEEAGVAMRMPYIYDSNFRYAPPPDPVPVPAPVATSRPFATITAPASQLATILPRYDVFYDGGMGMGQSTTTTPRQTAFPLITLRENFKDR